MKLFKTLFSTHAEKAAKLLQPALDERKKLADLHLWQAELRATHERLRAAAHREATPQALEAAAAAAHRLDSSFVVYQSTVQTSNERVAGTLAPSKAEILALLDAVASDFGKRANDAVAKHKRELDEAGAEGVSAEIPLAGILRAKGKEANYHAQTVSNSDDGKGSEAALAWIVENAAK